MLASEIITNVLAHLAREAGTDNYWTSATALSALNFIYRDLAKSLRNVKIVHTRTSSTTAGVLYDYPANLIAIEEVSFDSKLLDPISIYEIRMMDTEWRSRTGTPSWYCNDYIPGQLLLWDFPSSALEIKIVGPQIPNELTLGDTPSFPYSDGRVLEPGAVSMLLSQEGGGQNLERSTWWWQVFAQTVEDIKGPVFPSKDMVLRSIDNPRGKRFGPRMPSNYPATGWPRG